MADGRRKALNDAFLVSSFTYKLQFDADMLEGVVAELTDGVLYACGNDEVVRFRLLEDKPHALHVVLGISPVAQRAEIAEIEFLLLTLSDAGGSQSNFTSDEGLAATFRLMVEKDA